MTTHDFFLDWKSIGIAWRLLGVGSSTNAAAVEGKARPEILEADALRKNACRSLTAALKKSNIISALEG